MTIHDTSGTPRHESTRPGLRSISVSGKTIIFVIRDSCKCGTGTIQNGSHTEAGSTYLTLHVLGNPSYLFTLCILYLLSSGLVTWLYLFHQLGLHFINRSPRVLPRLLLLNVYQSACCARHGTETALPTALPSALPSILNNTLTLSLSLTLTTLDGDKHFCSIYY